MTKFKCRLGRGKAATRVLTFGYEFGPSATAFAKKHGESVALAMIISGARIWFQNYILRPLMEQKLPDGSWKFTEAEIQKQLNAAVIGAAPKFSPSPLETAITAMRQAGCTDAMVAEFEAQYRKNVLGEDSTADPEPEDDEPEDVPAT